MRRGLLRQKPRIDMVCWYGRPSSGKDFTIKQLHPRYPNAAIITPGEILRKSKNPIDPQYGRYHDLVEPYRWIMHEGGMLPQHIIREIIFTETEKAIAENKNVIFFNGFPRADGDLEAFNDLRNQLQKQGYRSRVLNIYLAISEATSAIRMQRRGIKSKERGEARGDEAKIAERLATYAKHTLPIINHFQRERQLVTIDAEASKADTIQSVEAVVDRFLMF